MVFFFTAQRKRTRILCQLCKRPTNGVVVYNIFCKGHACIKSLSYLVESQTYHCRLVTFSTACKDVCVSVVALYLAGFCWWNSLQFYVPCFTLLVSSCVRPSHGFWAFNRTRPLSVNNGGDFQCKLLWHSSRTSGNLFSTSVQALSLSLHAIMTVWFVAASWMV